jgi:anti-sigma B factor antagonist
VQFTSSGGCPLIVAIGEIDIFSAPLLRDAINSSMASQPDRLIVDLDRVPFIDSSGLSVLVGAMRLLPPGAFRVVTTQARVVRVFNLSGIDRILPVYPTVEAATNVQPAAPAD